MNETTGKFVSVDLCDAFKQIAVNKQVSNLSLVFGFSEEVSKRIVEATFCGKCGKTWLGCICIDYLESDLNNRKLFK